jgi:hypothetical protein
MIGPSILVWHEMSAFPRDGRTVIMRDDNGWISFARYEPEGGQTLKIVSCLGATRLGTVLSGQAWAELPEKMS